MAVLIYRYIMCIDVDRWIKKYQEIYVEGSNRRGSPRETWTEVMKVDFMMLNFTKQVTKECNKWCNTVLEMIPQPMQIWEKQV